MMKDLMKTAKDQLNTFLAKLNNLAFYRRFTTCKAHHENNIQGINKRFGKHSKHSIYVPCTLIQANVNKLMINMTPHKRWHIENKAYLKCTRFIYVR